MAHFRATIKGTRGEASRLGTKNSGLSATVNGWTNGVRVQAWHKTETNGPTDVIYLYATKGSNGYGEEYIGKVQDGKFVPAVGVQSEIKGLMPKAITATEEQRKLDTISEGSRSFYMG